MNVLPLSLIESSSNILIVGTQCTGKTYLIKDIIQYLSDTTFGVSLSSNTDTSYSTKNTTIYSIILMGTEHPISDFIEKQKGRLQTKPDTICRSNKPSALFIMDNWQTEEGIEENWIENKYVQTILKENKELQTTCLISVSQLTEIPAHLYTIFDFVFLFEQRNTESIRFVHSIFPTDVTFNKFKEIVKKCTNIQFNTVVICNKVLPESEHRLYNYRAS
jgi:hypothetical protein